VTPSTLSSSSRPATSIALDLLEPAVRRSDLRPLLELVRALGAGLARHGSAQGQFVGAALDQVAMLAFRAGIGTSIPVTDERGKRRAQRELRRLAASSSLAAVIDEHQGARAIERHLAGILSTTGSLSDVLAGLATARAVAPDHFLAAFRMARLSDLTIKQLALILAAEFDEGDAWNRNDAGHRRRGPGRKALILELAKGFARLMQSDKWDSPRATWTGGLPAWRAFLLRTRGQALLGVHDPSRKAQRRGSRSRRTHPDQPHVIAFPGRSVPSRGED
jgi:hypothetical protein